LKQHAPKTKTKQKIIPKEEEDKTEKKKENEK
jgi:hypothetical protein